MLLVLSASAAEVIPQWSEPVNGLRARLYILPAEKHDDPFCRIFIEMQNVEDVIGQKRIRFSPKRLHLQVADSRGTLLPIANGEYDGTSPRWDPIMLPYSGIIQFRISFPGLGYQPNEDKVIIDMGPSQSWVIPQSDTYYLSGTLSISKEPGDHPTMDWSGSISFPKVEIPKSNRAEQSVAEYDAQSASSSEP